MARRALYREYRPELFSEVIGQDHITTILKNQVREGKLSLRLLMDKESIELFINDGERVVTSLIPTPLEADGITFTADAPVCMSVEAHHLG